MYGLQKSIFFSCTLVIFAHKGFGTAAMETEAVWLIWGQILCRQLQSKLPHPALPLDWTLTCWDHPLTPATTQATFQPSEHRQSAKMPKYLCVKIHVHTGRSLDSFIGKHPRPPNAFWQSGIYWWTKALSACALPLGMNWVFEVKQWFKGKKKTHMHTEPPPPCNLVHLQQGSQSI